MEKNKQCSGFKCFKKKFNEPNQLHGSMLISLEIADLSRQYRKRLRMQALGNQDLKSDFPISQKFDPGELLSTSQFHYL